MHLYFGSLQICVILMPTVSFAPDVHSLRKNLSSKVTQTILSTVSGIAFHFAFICSKAMRKTVRIDLLHHENCPH